MYGVTMCEFEFCLLGCVSFGCVGMGCVGSSIKPTINLNQLSLWFMEKKNDFKRTFLSLT